MAGMEDNRRTPHRLAGWIIIVVVLIFVVYPLSQGPVSLTLVAMGKPEPLVRAGIVFYWPLRCIPEPFRRYLGQLEVAWIQMWPGEDN